MASNWYWHSAPNYGFQPPISDLRGTLSRSVTLLKWTADVHAQSDFPHPDPTVYVSDLEEKVAKGFLVIAYRGPDVDSPQGLGDDTLFFQKSKWLSQKLGHPVWSVSHGLNETNFNTTARPDNDYCRDYVHERLTTPLGEFISKMNLPYLYSIDGFKPDLSTPPPTNSRPIRRLQAWGNGHEWVKEGESTEYSDKTPCHWHWGVFYSGTWHFWLTVIRKK